MYSSIQIIEYILEAIGYTLVALFSYNIKILIKRYNSTKNKLDFFSKK